MSRRIARILLIVAIIGAAALIAFGMQALKEPPPKKPVDARAMLVDALVLEPLSTRFDVQSQGTVRPLTETTLSAEISGTITGISATFVAGGFFQADQELLRIDPTNYRVAVEQAEALVKQRQIEFDGAERLREQGYRAEAEYASAAAALAAARAELVRARRDLERTSIRLPFDGMVRSKAADLGQFVAPGTVLGTVFATDFAEVRLPLTDDDLAFVDLPLATGTAIADGPGVTLTAVQRGERREWPARIVRSEGVVDATSRVTYAVARIEDPYRLQTDGTALPVGTFVGASIEGHEVDGLFRVPRYALRGSDELLFIDAESKLRIRSVEIVHTDAEYAYIQEGVSAGDRIVLTAIESPFNGMAVRVVDDDEPPAGSEAAANAEAK